METVYVEITINPTEKRDFYYGRDEPSADIDWAYHLRMGDLRFVEDAKLVAAPEPLREVLREIQGTCQEVAHEVEDPIQAVNEIDALARKALRA